MMQLRFQAGADDWVKSLCADLSAQVKILGLKPVEKGVAHFVEISVEKESLDEVREWLGSSKSVSDTELTDLSKVHAMGVVVAHGCRACTAIIGTDSPMFVSSGSTAEDCTVGYKVFLNNEGVPSLLNRLSKDHVGYKVNDISPISSDSRLTSRQLGILKSAMAMGLYDFPRRITQDELAEKLGIKPSTLNEILRRAERNILGSFLNGSVENSA